MTVPPEWPRSLPAKVSLIGEAPAEQEELLGRPFVGRSGRLLNGMLRQVGLSRWDCHLTNIFPARLPGDSVLSFGMPRKEAHAALKEWEQHHDLDHPYRSHVLTAVAAGCYLHPSTVAHELDRLRVEIDNASPNIVVVLGGTAAWGLLGLPGHGTVSRIRGALLPEVLTGRKAICTYHPAAVLRNPKLREHLLSDLARALDESASPELVLDERTILIPEHPSEVRHFLLKECLNRPTAIDIETSKGQIDCIGFAPSRTRAMCVPIFDKKTRRSYWPTPEAEQAVVDHIAWFLEGSTPKVAQYGSQYDIQWLWEHWRIRTHNLCDDTRLARHALSPEQDKDLASIGGTFERLGPWKLMRRAATSDKRDD